MKFKFVDTTPKIKPKFKVGDIIALKEGDYGFRTGKTKYYLLGKCTPTHYCLIDIKTGELYMYQDYIPIRCLSKAELMDLIECYDGKVYKGDKAKLSLEETKTNK